MCFVLFSLGQVSQVEMNQSRGRVQVKVVAAALVQVVTVITQEEVFQTLSGELLGLCERLEMLPHF